MSQRTLKERILNKINNLIESGEKIISIIGGYQIDKIKVIFEYGIGHRLTIVDRSYSQSNNEISMEDIKLIHDVMQDEYESIKLNSVDNYLDDLTCHEEEYDDDYYD